MDLSLKIDVVKNITSKEFKNKYLNTQTPVVIKGLTENTIAHDKWSLGYFKETMGDLLIDIYDNGNKKSAASAYTTADLKMKFSDYLNIIINNKHTDLRIFLYNLFKHNENLRKEFPCPKIFNGVLDGAAFMFFGGKDTTVRIHYDIDMSNVLHTHFGGKKRVVLFAPEYSKLLYCLPLNTYALFDPDKPDYDKYPGLKFVKGYEVVLEPGDSIYMPCGYWHYMTYLDGSFSVSYRKIASGFKYKAEGILNLTLFMPIDKVLNKILGKNWIEIKKNIAEKRANHILDKHFFVDFKKILGI